MDVALTGLFHSFTLVGFPQGSPKQARQNAEGPSNAELAAIHTFGSIKRNIPPRPFMQETAKADGQTVKEMRVTQGKLLPHLQRGALTVKGYLAAIGEVYAGGIKRSIHDGNWKENAPRTIARKKSSKPLLDTLQMVNSVTHREVIS